MSEALYTVWVDGAEITDSAVDFDEAYYIASIWHVDEGHDDVKIEPAQEYRHERTTSNDTLDTVWKT